MKPLAVPPLAETVTIDYLTAELAARSQDVTCGVVIPSAWAPGTKPHVQVALDGTPVVQYPVLWWATVRVTVWATATTAAQNLAGLCEALLLSHAGSATVAGALPGTGLLVTTDPDTKAALASVTVRLKLRGVVVA